jgi:hypothetical protein
MDKIFCMTDIIPLLPLPHPPSGKSSYYVPCPRCDGRGRKKDKHLNINLKKCVFRCPKCGWNGGIFDLYAYYTGMPREDVRNELNRRFGSDDSRRSPGKPKPTIPKTPEAVESPVADIEIRHAAYSTMLSLLSLAPDHLRNLFERGLPPEKIGVLGYRTAPVAGGRALAERIQDIGHSLAGVPGFCKDDDGQWTFAATRRGILVPVRDIQGRIQGLKIRLDNEKKRKYRWVSGAGLTGGCGAEGWIHIAGPVRERVLLIEGPMKADVVHCFTGKTAIAVPGVNSLKHLEKTLIELVELGVNRVMTAFDMDFLKNPNVQSGYAELVNLLCRMNLRYGTYLWHPEYNGLDDYVRRFCPNVSHNIF